jgi:hypothetical protein
VSGSAGARTRSTFTPKNLLGRVELADVLTPLYIAVFVRQYLWAVADARAAWVMTAALTLPLWLAHLRLKGPVEGRTPRSFWLVVGLPLLAVYALRFAFPDFSFDVINHRLIQGERALRGPLLLSGDFFPTIFPFNPASDMMTGVARHLLGYRLGTVVNLAALLSAGAVLDKMLRPFVAGERARSLCVLVVVFTEYALFEVSNYMVDLLALPLIFEATRLALNYHLTERPTRDILHAALCVGASVALKLTNAAQIAPALFIFACQILGGPARTSARAWGRVGLAAAAALIPILPHAVYIYAQTGNPFFPLYNNVFKSALWPHVTLLDPRWGPRGWREALVWPLKIFFVPERISEFPVYTGRITAGILAALVCALLPRADRRMRLLSAGLVAGTLVWSFATGYIRYAVGLELMFGVVLVYVAHLLWSSAGAPSNRALGIAGRAAFAGLACLLAAQLAWAGVHAYEREWGGRPPLFSQPHEYRRDLRFVLRDRSLIDFLPREERELVSKVDVWVVGNVKTNGVEVLLLPDAPQIAVNNLPYFDMPEGRRRFARAVREGAGGGMYSMCLAEDLKETLDFLKRRRLEAGRVVPLNIRFFSDFRQLPMLLIEVKLAAPQDAARAAEAGPLDDDAFDAAVSVDAPPTSMRAGQKETIMVGVRNASQYAWPARPLSGGQFTVNVANTWLDARTGALVNNLDGRSPITRDLNPGDELQLPLSVTAPDAPGLYTLEIDMVQEGVAFFKEKGSTPLRLRLRVE